MQDFFPSVCPAAAALPSALIAPCITTALELIWNILHEPIVFSKNQYKIKKP